MKLSTFTYSDTNLATLPSIPLTHPDQTLIIMFGPSRLLDAPAPIQSILAAYPGAAAIGCSSSGEIFGTHIQDDTLVVGLLQFDHTTARAASAPVKDPGQSFEAAQSLANQLMDPGLRGVLVLSDGLGVNDPALPGGAFVNQEGICLRFAAGCHSSPLFRAGHPGRSW